MKMKHAIEGGIKGVSTLSILQEVLQKTDRGGAPSLHRSALLKTLKHGKKNKNKEHNEHLIRLAGEVLAGAGAFGLLGLGKKKHAVLNGGLLGAAAGLCVAFLEEDDDPKESTRADFMIDGQHDTGPDEIKDKALTVGLYTIGGVLAGLAVRELNRGGKKKSKLAKGLKKARTGKW